MENRVLRISVRVSPEEYDSVKNEAKKYGYSVSTFIRSKIFAPENMMPNDLRQILEKLDTDSVRIGTNINQIARMCNTKKFVTRNDYKNATDLLKEMDAVYEKILEEIKSLKE